jgi:hypothetical protein
MDLNAVKNEMITEARDAANKFFQEKLGGQDAYACGFAWVTVYPEHKGNTKAGKAERKILESLGLKKDWTGKGYEMWNPGQFHGQNVDTKFAGAQAAAAVLKRYGFKAYAQDRLD